jgi:putative transcriptional regulator
MIGGAVLLDIDPVPTGADAFEQLMERIEVKGAERPLLSRPAANDNPILPRVLQTYLEGDAESIQWNSIGMGVETSPISLGNTSKRAFMLKVPEGRAVPEHTHEGIELVLVLAGSYQDEIGNFGRGDLAISDSSVRHKPVADRGADCICLVVTDAPVRLTGMLGKILNLFVKV